MKIKKIISKGNMELIRFILVGFVNTLFGYSVFVLFIKLDFHYIYALFFTTCLGVLFNFKTIGKLVFRNTDRTLLFKFTMLYCTIYLLNIIILKILNGFHDDIYLNGTITIVLSAGLSFLGNKYLVFSKYENNKNKSLVIKNDFESLK